MYKGHFLQSIISTDETSNYMFGLTEFMFKRCEIVIFFFFFFFLRSDLGLRDPLYFPTDFPY